MFRKYLDSLTSAKPFLGERGFIALEKMGPARRHLVMERLHLVDPEGFRTIQKNSRKYRALVRTEKRKRLDSLQKQAEQEGLVAMAQEAFESEGVTKFRFVPVDGLLATVAYLLAVGHSRMEVSEKLKLDPEIVKMVTPQMVAEQKKNIGMETIIRAANQKVAFDLATNNVSKDTATADRIATRRMKLIIDARNSERRKGLLPSEVQERQETHAERFGITQEEDRKDEDNLA